jgi:hypothetical protein
MHRDVSNVLISTFANPAKLSPMSCIPTTASSRFLRSVTSSIARLAGTSTSTAQRATPLAAASLLTELATSACILLARTLIFVRIVRLCPSQSIQLIIPYSRSRPVGRLFLKFFVRGKRLGRGQCTSFQLCLASATSRRHRSPSRSLRRSTWAPREYLSYRCLPLSLCLCLFTSTHPLGQSRPPESQVRLLVGGIYRQQYTHLDRT